MKQNAEEYLGAGIPTFMRAPYVGVDELGSFDAAVLGVPVDHGVSYRAGARDAPRAIRVYSHWDRVSGQEYQDLDSGERLRSNRLAIADVGDVHIHPGEAELTGAAITEAVCAIRTRTFPLIIGGDHSITYWAFRGCKAGIADSLHPIGVLHFDAHLDLERHYLQLPRVWHGNPFRALIEEGHLTGDRLVTLGPRGIVPRPWVDFKVANNITVLTARRIVEMGIGGAIDLALTQLQRTCKSIYVTIDIDCLDPAIAPGTGTPLPGGLSVDQVVHCMRSLVRLPVVGLDLTEVSPAFDPSGRTLMAACEILWNFLAFGFRRAGT